MFVATKPPSKLQAIFLGTYIPKAVELELNSYSNDWEYNSHTMCWNEIPTRVRRNEIPMGHGRNCPLSIILHPVHSSASCEPYKYNLF